MPSEAHPHCAFPLCEHCPLVTSQQQARGLAILDVMPPGTMLEATELAATFGLPLDVLTARLEGLRAAADDAWREVDDRKGFRTVYRIGAVAGIVRELLTAGGRKVGGDL